MTRAERHAVAVTRLRLLGYLQPPAGQSKYASKGAARGATRWAPGKKGVRPGQTYIGPIAVEAAIENDLPAVRIAIPGATAYLNQRHTRRLLGWLKSEDPDFAGSIGAVAVFTRTGKRRLVFRDSSRRAAVPGEFVEQLKNVVEVITQ
jgi:hypothetical protein